MKKRRSKNIILLSIVCAIIMIAAVLYNTSNTQNIALNKNNSESIQLNEEYTKDDFILGEYTPNSGAGMESSVINLTEAGKAKLARNDGKLVLDGNVLGNIRAIGRSVRKTGCFSNIDITELEFKNLENIVVIGNAFNNTKLKK